MNVRKFVARVLFATLLAVLVVPSRFAPGSKPAECVVPARTAGRCVGRFGDCAVQSHNKRGDRYIDGARLQRRDDCGGTGITNPATMQIPAGGQTALQATEIFGAGVANFTGWIQVDASTPAVKGFFLVYNSGLTYIDGADLQATPASRLIFPEISTSGSSPTIISFVNTGAQTVPVAAISLFGNDGKLVSQTYMKLMPMSGFSGPVTTLFPKLSAFDGYAVVETAGTPFSSSVNSLVGFETYLNQSDIAALAATSDSSVQRIGYLPHLAAQAGYTTRLSLVNYSSETQIVQITAAGLETNAGPLTPASITVERTIPPFGRLEETAASMFNLSGNALISG